MTLMEVGAAAALLAVLLASSVQMLRVLSSRQRAADRHAIALQTAQNLMEGLTNTPWNDLVTGERTDLVVPSVVAPYLPGAQIKSVIVDEVEPIASKRISIELSWNTPSGQPGGPLRLTAWAFPETSAE